MNGIRRFCAASLLLLAAASGTISIGLFVLAPAGSLHFFSPHWPVAGVLGWDAFLCLLFFIQHSGMVRRRFRARVARRFPPWSYPAVYTIVSSLALTALVVFWLPTERRLLVLDGLASRIAQGITLFAFAFFVWGAIALKGFDPFGLSPIRAHMRGWEEPRPAFTINGPYRLVRHPLYFSVLLFFWFPVELTWHRLVFNVLWTVWIWVATGWEERDLVNDFGEAYRGYQRRVPMLIPWRGASS